jgi:2-(1,2-epoxy-1,2-dihydrophenyl)acetyl-CoA isomerase
VKAMNDPKRQDVVFGRTRMRRSQARLFDLLNLEAPVIAAVNGHAAGAGFGLAMMADFIVASPLTRFTCSFGRIGLMPDWGLLYTLPRAVDMQKAKDIMFTNRRVRPDEGEALGIVHHTAASDEELMADATAFARRFTKASTTAIGMTKNLRTKSFEMHHRTMLENEAFGQPILTQTAYHKEAVRRFADKEQPMFDWEQIERDEG